MKYDIFISYRRESGGYEAALPLVEKLRSAGYRVFFDLEDLNPGKFNEQLLGVIERCKDFVVVLPANGLDRCGDPGDWVRREIVHAIACDKNIIPVMLRGFAWPSELPPELAELPDYQGISASSPEFFDMAVARLRSYLKSRPHGRVRRILIRMLAAAAVVSLVGYFAFRQYSMPFYKEVASYHTSAMHLIHEMADGYLANDRTLRKSLAQRERLAVSLRPDFDRELIASIDEYCIPPLEQTYRKFSPRFETVTPVQRMMLGLRGIDPMEIGCMPQVVEMEYEEIAQHYAFVKQVLAANIPNELVDEYMDCTAQAHKNWLNSFYYGYLDLLSQLPASSRLTFAQIADKWTLYPSGAPLDLPHEEYERMQRSEAEKAEKALDACRLGIRDSEVLLALAAEQTEAFCGTLDSLDGLKKQLSDGLQRVGRIERLHAEVKELRAEHEEKCRQVREAYARICAKDEILSSDEQYRKWGKIVHFATFMETVAKNRAQHDESQLDPGEVYGRLNGMLDCYLSHHPETIDYVLAAKAFYREVARGARPAGGLIVMGTKDDVPHPFYRVGDTIVERNGRRIDTVDDLRAAMELADPGSAKVLRLDGDALRAVAAELPRTEVEIGTLPLKQI